MNLYEKYNSIIEMEIPDHWEVNPETGWATIPPDEYPDLSTGGFYLSDIMPFIDAFVDAVGPQGPPVTGKWTIDPHTGGDIFIPDPPKPKPGPVDIMTQAEYDASKPKPNPKPKPEPRPVLTPTMQGILNTIDIFQNWQDAGQGDHEETINDLWMQYANEILKEAGIIVE